MHSAELKEQVVKEIQEVSNVILVCKRHGLRPSTVHGWLNLKKTKQRVSKKD